MKRDCSSISLEGRTIVGTLDFTGEEELKKLYFSDVDVKGKVLILTSCSFEDDDVRLKVQEACANLGVDYRDDYKPISSLVDEEDFERRACPYMRLR